MGTVFLIFFGAISRLIPHPGNATAITAVALFSGYKTPKRTGWIVPLTAMLLSDILLGFLHGTIGFTLHPNMPYVYGSFVLIWALGLLLKKGPKVLPIISVTILASTLFFIITNFGVWAGPMQMYPHTFSGLLACYAAGLPFFRNMLIGDLVYTGALFGVYALLKNNTLLVKKTKTVTQVIS